LNAAAITGAARYGPEIGGNVAANACAPAVELVNMVAGIAASIFPIKALIL
jgi:hypothetical protein